MLRTLSSNRPLRVVVLAVVAIALFTGGAYAAALRKNGGTVVAVRTVAANSLAETTSQTFTNVPDTNVSVVVPAGQRALLLITFSGMSHCTGSTFCYVRALVDGLPAEPSTIVFDSGEDSGTGNVNSWESNSMQFVAAVKAGTHSVRIQYSVQPYEGAFKLTSRSLTVLQAEQ